MDLYTCDQCGQCFNYKSQLLRHQNKKKGCLSTQKQIQSFQSEKNDNQTLSEDQCIKCKKYFSSKSTLNRHLRNKKCVYTQDDVDRLMKKNDSTNRQNNDKLGYIYIIREREFIRLNENTYKVGKTEQIPSRRLNGYPKGSEVVLFINVSNCHEFERLILEEFDKVFEKRQEYGREYYTGDKDDMINLINVLKNDFTSLNK